MQDDCATLPARPLDQREVKQAVERVGKPAARFRVVHRDIGAQPQQVARDRLAGSQPRGAGEQLAGEGVGRVVGPQPAQAHLEGAGDVLLVAGERPGAARRLRVLDPQRGVCEHIRRGQLSEVGSGRADRLVPVAGKVAAGQLKGERQVAEFVRNSIEAGIVGPEVWAVPMQKCQALAAGQTAEGNRRDATSGRPG